MNGDGAPEFAEWIGRICEEFHCLPSQALIEWQDAPCGLLEDIIEARAFAAAKQVVDSTADAKHLPDSPMVALVQQIEFAVAAEEIARGE